MSSDFDFGEFLDETNQSELMILCLELFAVLTKFQVDHNKLETAKGEILNNQLTQNFEGFRSAISYLSGGDKNSQINAMKHINLMVDTLVGDSKSTEKYMEIEKVVIEAVDGLIKRIDSNDDLSKLVQVYNFLPYKKEIAILLGRITDYELKEFETMENVKAAVLKDNVEVLLSKILAEISDESASGFISDNIADIFQRRGVDFHIAGLVTKESLENLSDEQLKNSVLLMVNFSEDIFTSNPEFLENIQSDTDVLTSTSGEDEDTFDMLLLLKNEKRGDMFDKYPVKVKEYRVFK
mgnify:FL=1